MAWGGGGARAGAGVRVLRARHMSRRRLVCALAGLWLLDGILQLQPGMFSTALILRVMQPAVVGNPAWVNAGLQATMHILTRYIVIGNVAVALMQLATGTSLFVWGSRQRWPYWLSLMWAILLWPFGQAYGGVFSTTGSLWTGAPGSAVGYALLTWAAWPSPTRLEDPASDEGRRNAIRLAVGGVWALGAVLQTSVANFTGSGLSGLVTGVVSGQPAWLATLLTAAAHVLANRPVLYNSLAIGVCATCAVSIFTPPLRRFGLGLSVAAAVVAWVFGQGFGMLFTGMATDPNTAPLLVLLAIYGWPGASVAGNKRSLAPPMRGRLRKVGAVYPPSQRLSGTTPLERERGSGTM